jgi:hypothetical protein
VGSRPLTYLLDNNLIQYFLHAGRERDLIAAAEVFPMAAAREVIAEAQRGKHAARRRHSRRV